MSSDGAIFLCATPIFPIDETYAHFSLKIHHFHHTNKKICLITNSYVSYGNGFTNFLYLFKAAEAPTFTCSMQ